jgi:Occludin homology domain
MIFLDASLLLMDLSVICTLLDTLGNVCELFVQVVKEQIISEYRILQADHKYLVRRSRCDYLHAKLAHIKSLVDSFDKANLAADVTTLQC